MSSTGTVYDVYPYVALSSGYCVLFAPRATPLAQKHGEAMGIGAAGMVAAEFGES